MKRWPGALGLLVCCLSGAHRAAGEGPPTAEQTAFFEKKIRPVLATHCFKCHAADSEKLRGELVLDSRDGLRKGGQSGAVVVPGYPEKSLLIKAIRHTDDRRKMPKDKLPDEVIADFERWVTMGAPDPREGGLKIARAIDIEKGRKFWAFQPPKKAPPPAVKDTAWPRSDVDRFLLAGLEEKGLTPAGDADRRALLRRVCFDLIGLPPTPEEVEAFLGDRSPKAFETVVDQLLASPRFGERWGRHWLDVARFAESSGKQANFAYPHAWRYRDYVTAAFNADKPYDQFVREQLAGDLLPAADDQQKAEHLVATGFLAVGAKLHNERDPRQFQMDLADEQIDATSVAFLGLTVACARCHDHKFDPIPQKDYYALAGIFRSTETCYGTIRVIQNNHPGALLTLPRYAGLTAALDPLTAERRAEMEKQVADLRQSLQKLTPAERMGSMMAIRLRVQSAVLQGRLDLYEADGTPKPLAMGVRERSFPADSKLYVRGELDQPGDTIRRGFPQVVAAKQPVIVKGSGRLELANWIGSADNPLTARVMANRVWLHLFGRGLVATPDNFGAAGQKPGNQALLDHLAVSFVENGWSVKKLIRSLVLTRAYQQSSEFVAKNHEVDPDNALVWRMSRRRLEAEAIRDAILAVAGRLDLTAPKGGPVAQGGEGNVGFVFRGRGPDALGGTTRSVYLPIVRELLPESLTLFDFPDPTLISGERATTTIPAQSLYLMNNPFVIRQAEAVADKLLAGNDTDAEKVARAYALFYSRPPSAKERLTALNFLDRYTRTVGDEKAGTPAAVRRVAWSALCQALFASSEFSHR